MANPRQKAVALSFVLFALNAWICHKLFAIGFTHLHNNAAGFMAISRFYREHWRDLAWLPWFDAGKPIEYAYQPLLPILTAVLNAISPWSIPRCYEVVLATFYCFGPVALFWFALEWSGAASLSFLIGLTYSLLSPSLMFIPVIRIPPAGMWAAGRLYSLVYYGEGPHNLAVSLLPLGLLFLHRAIALPTARRIAAAAISCAAVVLANAFGAVDLAIGAICIVLALRRGWATVAITGLAAWFLASPFLPPSLIATIARNAWTARGYYSAGIGSYVAEATLLGSFAAVWFVTRRFTPFQRFVCLFAPWMFVIPIAYIVWKITIVPQGNRYALEMDMAGCLLFSIAAWWLLESAPKPARIALGLALVFLLVHQTREYRNFAHQLIRPVDIAKTVEYKLTQWTDHNLPGERTMVGGDSQYVFNVYSDNPQLAAGHEPTAPNFEQQIAVYGIYTGDGAGARDAAISILWLKAFGTTSISVPGPDTKEYYHPFRNAAKFDGVLPVLWHEDGDTIYGVPMRSRSLAHVIPPEAAVQRPPVNSIDIEELEAYVSALDNPALPLAEIQWGSPSHGTIRSRMSRSQAVSVQVSWNPAWRASSGGHRVPVRKDGLGLILIEPACDGDCTIDLSYGATFETWLCRALSALAVVALAVTSIPMRVNNRPST